MQLSLTPTLEHMTFVFAVAGSSRAVGGEQYPTTVEFFEMLPDSIRQHQAFAMVEQYLGHQAGAGLIDIEKVLWTMSELVEFSDRLRDSRTIPGWFYQQERLGPLTGNNQGLGGLHAMADSLRSMMTSVRSSIQEMVYKLYRREPDRSQLEDNWIPLIELLRPGGRFDIFTTNYDVVIETALQEAALDLTTGRTTRIQQRIDLSEWIDVESGVDSRGLLTKLHGSVDWARDGETIYAGTPLFQGAHDRHVILYPGFKGVPIVEPFALFHRHLERVARESKLALFIGFAFRDEHINSILRGSLSRDCVVIDVNPGASGAGEALRREVHHIQQGFGREAVGAVASTIGTTLSARYRVR